MYYFPTPLTNWNGTNQPWIFGAYFDVNTGPDSIIYSIVLETTQVLGL